MYSNRLQKIASMMLAISLAFTMIFVSAMEVRAEDEWQVSISEYGFVGQKNIGVDVYKYDLNTDKYVDATVTSVKSSNPGVVKITKDSWKDNGKTVTHFFMKFKKVGKATITVKYKTPGGEKRTIKERVNVKKYPYQIKSLKVNGKKVNINKHKHDFTKDGFKGTKATVKMALKNGWKIDSVYASVYDKNYNYKDIKVTKKQIANGSKIKFAKKYKGLGMSIMLVNKKTYEYMNYYVEITR